MCNFCEYARGYEPDDADSLEYIQHYNATLMRASEGLITAQETADELGVPLSEIADELFLRNLDERQPPDYADLPF